MRMRSARNRGRALLRVMFCAMLSVTIAGCSDILAAAGLTDLSGYWVGRYDSDFDFYLDLDDDVYGVYGRAGLVRGGSYSDIYVDAVRDGSRIVFYADEPGYGSTPIFEGHVTGRDRIDGIAYLEVIPRAVILHRQ